MKTSIILILPLIILAGCASNADRIKVGVMLPQTGLGASLGDQIQKGIDLAENETGYPFEMIIEDDQCDAKQGVVAAKKLVEVDQVDAIIGPICTVAILPSIDIIESAKVPRITTGMVVQKVAEAGPYHFSFLPEMKHQLRSMTEYASQKGYASIAAIAINDDLGKESIAELKQALSAKGIDIVAEEYFDRPETDFRARLTKISSAQPDAVYMMGYAANMIGIAKQARELDIKADLLTWSLFQDPAVIAGLGDIAEGVIFTYPEDPRELAVKAAFKKKFIRTYGVEPGVYAANAYDSYKILAKAISICDTDKDCIKTELSSIKDYEGANGFITVDRRGVGQRSEVSMKVVRNGSFMVKGIS